jgi:hypothetical protein
MIPTTVCNTQNYWVSGLCPSSGILNTGKHNVSETGSVSKFFLRVPTQVSFSLSSHPRTETDAVAETLYFPVFRIPDSGQTPETSRSE